MSNEIMSLSDKGVIKENAYVKVDTIKCNNSENDMVIFNSPVAS